MFKRANIALLLAALLVSGCVEERPRDPKLECIGFESEVRTLLADQCVSCHSSQNSEGAYALDEYASVLSSGSDGIPNAIAGDSSSRLLTILTATTVDDTHQSFARDGATYEMLREWVVDCKLSYRVSRIHEGGIMNPSDPDFHGALLRSESYDFDLCVECHGADFRGGKSRSSCITCHESGPKDCSTCHPSVETSGAHAAHLEPRLLGKQLVCEDCHVIPKSLEDPGHVFLADGSLDPPPLEVNMRGLAALDVGGTPRDPPFYDHETKTCGLVYCHGDTFEDSSAKNTRPEWFSGTGQADCGTCHGLPPSTHAIEPCEICHQPVAGPNNTLRDTALHLNGEVEITGDPAAPCVGCHGSDRSPAPPPSIFGETETSTTPVGAHDVHLNPRFGLRGPMACEDCHQVPSEVLGSGHIDTPLPAEVFPLTTSTTSLAFADGASPMWNRETGRCENVYCHGAGARYEKDSSPTLAPSPSWTRVEVGEVYCGGCHGVPPTNFPHLSWFQLTDCKFCHSRSVDDFGFPIVSESGESEHIDGEVDL